MDRSSQPSLPCGSVQPVIGRRGKGGLRGVSGGGQRSRHGRSTPGDMTQFTGQLLAFPCPGLTPSIPGSLWAVKPESALGIDPSRPGVLRDMCPSGRSQLPGPPLRFWLMSVLGMRKIDESVGGRRDLGASFRGRLDKEALAPCEMRLGP